MTDPLPPALRPDLVPALERAALNAVPAPRVAFDGAFVARGFLGGTGRANAACALDPAPDPALAERVGRIEADYRRWNLAPRFRLTPLAPPALAPLLLARGYRAAGADTLVMAGPLSALLSPPAAAAEVTALDAPEADWMAVLATGEHQTPARRAEKAQSVAMLARPAAWLLLRVDGVPAAGAFAVADAGLCGLFDVGTDPRFRRQGLARAVLAAAARWAAERGADTAWLQVSADNHGAVSLYEALGLREAYRYRYLLR